MDLLSASREGDKSAVEAFFAQKDSTQLYTEARDEYSLATPLHNAAANDHIEILRYILDHLEESRKKELVNAVNDAGNTALHWAALTGSLEAVKLLVDAGADALLKNKAGIDSIFQAEATDNEEIVDFLLERFDVTPEDIEDTNERPTYQEETDKEQESSEKSSDKQAAQATSEKDNIADLGEKIESL